MMSESYAPSAAVAKQLGDTIALLTRWWMTAQSDEERAAINDARAALIWLLSGERVVMQRGPYRRGEYADGK